jgi:hypothetical protein
LHLNHSSALLKVSSAEGGWRHVPERIPDNWFSRRAPYTNNDVTLENLALYTKYPKLFGGNAGMNNFDALSTPFGIIRDGKLPDDVKAKDLICLLYQLGTMVLRSTLSTATDITGAALAWTVRELNPVFKNAGCALSFRIAQNITHCQSLQNSADALSQPCDFRSFQIVPVLVLCHLHNS